MSGEVNMIPALRKFRGGGPVQANLGGGQSRGEAQLKKTPCKIHSLQRSRGGAHTDHKRGGSFNLKFSNALSMQKEINVEVYGVVLALYTLHNLEQLQELFLKSVSHIPNAMLNSKSIFLNLSHHMPPVS